MTGQMITLSIGHTLLWLFGLTGLSFFTRRQRKNELALIASESKTRTITDSVLDAIIMLNEKGEVEFWNPATEKLFGFNQQEVMGKSLSSLIIPQQHRATHEAGLQGFVKSGTCHMIGKVVELSAMKKNGAEFPIVNRNRLFKVTMG